MRRHHASGQQYVLRPASAEKKSNAPDQGALMHRDYNLRCGYRNSIVCRGCPRAIKSQGALIRGLAKGIKIRLSIFRKTRFLEQGLTRILSIEILALRAFQDYFDRYLQTIKGVVLEKTQPIFQKVVKEGSAIYTSAYVDDH